MVENGIEGYFRRQSRCFAFIRWPGTLSFQTVSDEQD